MTVKELIMLLKEEDPDRLVVLAGDEEGNFFSTLENTYTFTRGLFIEDDEYFVDERDEEEIEYHTPYGLKALVLWPGV